MKRHLTNESVFSEAWWNSTWGIKAFCFMFLYQFGEVPFLDEILMMHTLCCAYLLSRVRLFAPKDCRPPGSSVHGDSPGKNTGVGCHVLLQGIFPTQESNQVFQIAGQLFTYSATREAQWYISVLFSSWSLANQSCFVLFLVIAEKL